MLEKCSCACASLAQQNAEPLLFRVLSLHSGCLKFCLCSDALQGTFFKGNVYVQLLPTVLHPSGHISSILIHLNKTTSVMVHSLLSYAQRVVYDITKFFTQSDKLIWSSSILSTSVQPEINLRTNFRRSRCLKYYLA